MRRPVVSLLSSVTVAAAAVMLAACGSTSSNTDTATSSASASASGSVTFDDTEQKQVSNGVATTSVELGGEPVTVAVKAFGMAPGDFVFRKIVVSNPSSETARYAVTGDSVEGRVRGLSKATSLAVVALPSKDSKCDTDGFTTGDLLTGKHARVGQTTVFGDASAGAQAGDQTVPGRGSQTLCVRMGLSVNAKARLMDATATEVFSFTGEAVKN